MLLCTGRNFKLTERHIERQRPAQQHRQHQHRYSATSSSPRTASSPGASPGSGVSLRPLRRLIYRPIDGEQAGRWQHEVANHYRDYVERRRTCRSLRKRGVAVRGGGGRPAVRPVQRRVAALDGSESAAQRRSVLSVPTFAFPRCVLG